MKKHTGTRAFTLVELLVVIAIIALLIGLLLPALAKAQASARSVKDATQIGQIHKSFIIFSNDAKGRYPTPGLIDRKPMAIAGGGTTEIPGQGEEDFARNNTANLYSAMVAREYFNTEILIGPTEVNPVVMEKKDYDYAEYDPSSDTYWDESFLANIHLAPGGNNAECNTSYSHMAICGERKKTRWKNTNSSVHVIMGTRGTEQGTTTGDKYSKSPTLQLHGPKKEWQGNIAYADNHVDTHTTFMPDAVSYECGDIHLSKDNIFACEFPCFGSSPTQRARAGDAWNIICIGSPTELAATGVYDALIQ